MRKILWKEAYKETFEEDFNYCDKTFNRLLEIGDKEFVNGDCHEVKVDLENKKVWFNGFEYDGLGYIFIELSFEELKSKHGFNILEDY